MRESNLTRRVPSWTVVAVLLVIFNVASGPSNITFAQTDTPAIAFGTRHAVALRGNGDVLTWGDNVGCQLGRPGGNGSATPGLAIRNAKRIAAAAEHTLVLTSDGKVYGWGSNPEGALGVDNTFDQCDGPTLVESLADKTIAHIATGHGFSLAVTSDGNLYCAGDNSMGQCPPAGRGRIETFAPVVIPALAGNVVAIRAGASHALVLTKDRRLFAFGRGRDGQLGDGRTTNGAGVVTTLNDVVSFSAGTWHSVAALADGTVWTWGHNLKSQLCDGTTVNRTTPTKVSGLPAGTRITGVAAGGHGTLLRSSDGAIYGCGDNQFGALGADQPNVVATPARLTATSHPAGFAIGGANAAFSTDGCAVHVSGDNDRGISRASSAAGSSAFATRMDLSLCGPRPASALATLLRERPRGGVSGCWAPRLQEDGAGQPRFARLTEKMIAAEAILAKNESYLAAPSPVRFRTSLSAGPSIDGGGRMHIKAVPERKTDGSRLWATAGCGVIPQIDRIGGAIGQISIVFNDDPRGALIGPAGTPPKVTGQAGGYTEYNGWLLVTKGGRVPWIPVTLAEKLDAEHTRREKALEDWNRSRAGMKAMDPAAVLQTYEMLKRTDPADAEKFVASMKAQTAELERLQREVDPATTRQLEEQLRDVAAYRATFTPEQLGAAAVWFESPAEARRRVDAELDTIRRATPNREQAAPLIQAAAARLELRNIRPGPTDRAISVKPDPAFPDRSTPQRIQTIIVNFSFDPDPRQTERRAWQQRTRDTFDFAALVALLD